MKREAIDAEVGTQSDAALSEGLAEMVAPAAMCFRKGASPLPYSTREIAAHGGGGHLVHRRPDMPNVEMETMNLLPGIVDVPKPLLPFKEIGVGGGRTIGGGTSRDATRRAKRNTQGKWW